MRWQRAGSYIVIPSFLTSFIESDDDKKIAFFGRKMALSQDGSGQNQDL
jgi:hypothetical protein